MQRTANEEAVQECVKYIMFSGDYKIMDYLRSEGLVNGEDKGGRDTKILCPFHKEKTPSMYIDEENNQFFCQSCGRGGRYLQMVKFVKTIVHGESFNFYGLLNNILTEDVRMQLQTGFNTIFHLERKRLKDLDGFVLPKFKKKEGALVEDLGDLRAEMQRRGFMSIPEIRLACLFVQDGFSPQETLKALSKEGTFETNVDFKGVDIDDLLDDIQIEIGDLYG